jgi:4-hydroxybenzoate polyprenyltransferase
LKQVNNYLSLIKFSHTIFAMPFALIGFFLGMEAVQSPISQVPGWCATVTPNDPIVNPSTHQLINLSTNQLITKFLLVLACMVFARSAAMAFNRYLDSRFDAQNPRTAIREIPAGLIARNSALWFVIVCCALFVAATFFINRICFYLSPVALFVILFYSYTKRFTALCHLVLGLGLSLAPVGAFLAVTGVFHPLPILLGCTVLCWVSGFDIIYALQDEEFDRSQQLHSIPVWLGKARALRVSEGLHLLAVGCLVAAGWLYGWGYWYWAGVIIFAGLLVYQHLLVKPTDLSKVNMAFFTTNGIASVVFAALVITDLLTR